MSFKHCARIEDFFDEGENNLRIDVSIIDLSPDATDHREFRLFSSPKWAGSPSRIKHTKTRRLQEKVFSLEMPRSHTSSIPFGIRVRLSMDFPTHTFLCRIAIDRFPSYETVILVPSEDSTTEAIIEHIVLVGDNYGGKQDLKTHTLCFPPQGLKRVGEELKDNPLDYGLIQVNIREVLTIPDATKDASPPWIDRFTNKFIRSVRAFEERDEEANIGADQPWEIERLGGRPLEYFRRVEFRERFPLERDVAHLKPTFTGVQYMLKFWYASADTLIRDDLLANESTASLEFPREPFQWPLLDPELQIASDAPDQSIASSADNRTSSFYNFLQNVSGKARPKRCEEAEVEVGMGHNERIEKLRRRYKLWKGVDYHLGRIQLPENSNQQEINEAYIRRMEKIGLRIQDKDLRLDLHPAHIIPFLTVPSEMEKRTPADSHKMRVLLAKKLLDAVTENQTINNHLETQQLDEQQTMDRNRRIQLVHNLTTYVELPNPKNILILE